MLWLVEPNDPQYPARCYGSLRQKPPTRRRVGLLVSRIMATVLGFLLSPRRFGGSGMFWKASVLHGAFYPWSFLDRVGFGRAHPCFNLTIWF
jgi:hypothetical protein